MLKKVLLLVFLILSVSGAPAESSGENKNHAVQYEKGQVIAVGELDSTMRKQYFMEQGELVTIRLTSGPDAGKIVEAFNYFSGKSPYEIRVNPGDKIIVAIASDLGKTTYHVSDFQRFDYVYVLLGIFVACLVVFGGIVGIKSVLVIGVSTLIIFDFFIGQVLTSHMSLTLLTLLVSVVIATLTLVTISGWNKKSFAAIAGTIGGVTIAGVLSMLAIKLMHLTGLDSEEAMLLKAALLPNIDFQGVLFAGMVLGALGAVMDVTISIASALYEVKAIRPSIGLKELFVTGMNVGRDIMGTMSNTLILAYAGSSLPLMLLIASQQQTAPLKIMNLNLIVTEIARALTGSIGLICAIPLTAFITALLLKDK